MIHMSANTPVWPVPLSDHAIYYDCEVRNWNLFVTRVRLTNAYYWEDGARLEPGATAWIRVPAGEIAVTAFDVETGRGLFARLVQVHEPLLFPLDGSDNFEAVPLSSNGSS